MPCRGDETKRNIPRLTDEVAQAPERQVDVGFSLGRRVLLEYRRPGSPLRYAVSIGDTKVWC